MNDKELLELAAKAAGYELKQGCGLPPEKDMFYCDDDGCHDWNPLDDDGDALRLAVKIEMTIDFCEGKIWHNRIEIDFDGGVDQNAIARRAIVRVAAEIGKSL